jgi:hypothetical protein
MRESTVVQIPQEPEQLLGLSHEPANVQAKAHLEKRKASINIDQRPLHWLFNAS